MKFTTAAANTYTNNEPIIGQTSNAHGFMIGLTNSTAIQYYTNPQTPRFVEGEVVLGKTSGAVLTIATSVPATLMINTVDQFVNTEVIQGATGRALGHVLTASWAANVATLTYTVIKGTFVVGETVTGQTSETSGDALTANARVVGLTLGTIDNGYFEVPEDIIAVRKVFPPFDSRISADILFDPQSQFNISLLSNFTSNSIIPYYIGRQYQQLLNDTFRGRPGLRFQRHMNRIYVDVKWPTTVLPNQYWIIECSQTIDPDTFYHIWSDRWLQRYGIALMKRQWGMNLSKFTGVALPGGVQLDGRTMLSEANQEVKDLELELRNEFQEPPCFFVG